MACGNSEPLRVYPNIVTLSAAKGLRSDKKRFFAALRMTTTRFGDRFLVVACREHPRSIGRGVVEQFLLLEVEGDLRLGGFGSVAAVHEIE